MLCQEIEAQHIFTKNMELVVRNTGRHQYAIRNVDHDWTTLSVPCYVLVKVLPTEL